MIANPRCRAYLVGVLICHSAFVSLVGRADDGPVHGLMPVPAEVSFELGALPLRADFLVVLSGHSDERLRTAVERTVRRLADATGTPIEARTPDASVAASLSIRCGGPGEAVQTIAEDETYTLRVTSNGAELRAKSAVGVLRGLATFEQLVELGPRGFQIPAVTIADRPRFPWRGLLIDVCRHWQPIEVIKRNLDGMAAVKLNVLHWHLTEDQGFRVESNLYPKLHGHGSDGHYFTQDQIREVVAYARGLGIRVVPEFDMPGHSASWLVGHPELAAGPGPFEIIRRWGVHDPCLDPTRAEVYAFLDGFIGEMVGLFPDAYFHIGGDEVNGKSWDGNPSIQAFMKKHEIEDRHELQASFNQRVSAILAKHDRKMIGWDEILHPSLPANIVVQSWRGPDALVETVRGGRMGILSNGYYLDHQQPASFHYAVDPMAKAGELDDAARARILGGEACMWGEFVTPETIDSRIWPRLAAVAERLWSPAEITDVDDMYRRLGVVSRQLDRIGLQHHANYDRMLRRLAGRFPVGPLRVLADIVTPVKLYSRSSSTNYTSFTPLNRLVDAARPESDAARHFSRMVDGALSSALTASADRLAVKRQLMKWRENRAGLAPIIRQSALLREVEAISDGVALLASAGLEALEVIQSGQTPPRTWRKEQELMLSRVGTPHAEVEIAIIPAIRKLLDAAAPLPD